MLRRAVCTGALLLGGICFCNPAVASGMASLDGIQEIIVEPVLFNDPKAADACGLSRDDLTAEAMKQLQATGVPATLATDAKPPMIGVARIELHMLVYTINTQELDCSSWVEATASSRSNVSVPPIDTLRNVTIDYWHQGTIIAGSQSLHERMIGKILEKMMQDFGKQYKVDQPPVLH